MGGLRAATSHIGQQVHRVAGNGTPSQAAAAHLHVFEPAVHHRGRDGHLHWVAEGGPGVNTLGGHVVRSNEPCKGSAADWHKTRAQTW